MLAARAVFAGLALLGALDACAQEPLQPLVPAIVEYRWRPLVPHWVVDARVVQPAASLDWRAQPVPYAMPDFELVERRIGTVPEFECKYSDLGLPNACTTHWRAVYAMVPVAVVRRDTLDLDVPQWRQPGEAFVVEVPRLEWKEETLVVSLPALATADCAAAREAPAQRCRPRAGK
jgi:hypothetical protein